MPLKPHLGTSQDASLAAHEVHTSDGLAVDREPDLVARRVPGARPNKPMKGRLGFLLPGGVDNDHSAMTQVMLKAGEVVAASADRPFLL